VHEELKGPGWCGLPITDDEGQLFHLLPTGTVNPNNDSVRIKVVAEGFADLYRPTITKGDSDGSHACACAMVPWTTHHRATGW
jgi:hypothetical protein